MANYQMYGARFKARSGKANMVLQDKAYDISVRVVKLTNALELGRRNHSLVDQVLRSGTSVAGNVFEARAAHSKKDWIKFYEIALKSANETLFWLCMLADAELVDKDKLLPLTDAVEEVAKMLAASVITGKGRRDYES